MKTLIILRHAKTQPDAPAGDHARALTERGLRDAAATGAYIASLFGKPDVIVTSDATRAMQTAEIVASEVGFTAPVTVEPLIYGAEAKTLIARVREIPDAADRALIIGHNPGFEDLAARLADGDDDIRLPTAAFAALEFDVQGWDAVRPGRGRLTQVATPRSIAG